MSFWDYADLILKAEYGENQQHQLLINQKNCFGNVEKLFCQAQCHYTYTKKGQSLYGVAPPSQLVKVNDYVHGEKAQGSNE